MPDISRRAALALTTALPAACGRRERACGPPDLPS